MEFCLRSVGNYKDCSCFSSLCYSQKVFFFFFSLIDIMYKGCFCSSHLQEELELVKKDNRRQQTELDDKRIDYDKFKALQSHSAHQQVLLHQLRNRLEEHE